MIAIWKLPVILVCENNLYSEMTPSHETTSTRETWKRAAAYGIRAVQVDGNDVEAMYCRGGGAAQPGLAGEGATYLEAKTYRLWGHMMGDPEVYRTKEEVPRPANNEPIVRLGRRLNRVGQDVTADLSSSGKRG